MEFWFALGIKTDSPQPDPWVTPKLDSLYETPFFEVIN